MASSTVSSTSITTIPMDNGELASHQSTEEVSYYCYFLSCFSIVREILTLTVLQMKPMIADVEPLECLLYPSEENCWAEECPKCGDEVIHLCFSCTFSHFHMIPFVSYAYLCSVGRINGYVTLPGVLLVTLRRRKRKSARKR